MVNIDFPQITKCEEAIIKWLYGAPGSWSVWHISHGYGLRKGTGFSEPTTRKYCELLVKGKVLSKTVVKKKGGDYHNKRTTYCIEPDRMRGDIDLIDLMHNVILHQNNRRVRHG